jgi:hypothetical protein
MGALKGSVTVRRYQVKGDPPQDHGRIMKGLRAHVLVPIDPAGEIERSWGWAAIEDPEDLDLSTEKVFFGDAVAITLRVDALRPPPQVVKRLVLERLRSLGRKPNRAEKQQAKEEVKKTLRKRYYPTVRNVDVVWRPDAERLYFWSHAKGMNELLADLMAKSFSLGLEPLGPATPEGKRAIPLGLAPAVEMIYGFPGMPGRPIAGEDGDDTEEEGADA